MLLDEPVTDTQQNALIPKHKIVGTHAPFIKYLGRYSYNQRLKRRSTNVYYC